MNIHFHPGDLKYLVVISHSSINKVRVNKAFPVTDETASRL